MAYRLKAGESVPENIKRVVLEEIESANNLLGRTQPQQREETVHEARKSLKKIRGVLRLVQPELGKTYRQENRHFRDVGRDLSQIRDAAALLEIFDQLIKKHREAIVGKSFAALRRGLDQDKRDIEQRLDIRKVITRASSGMRSATKRVPKWPLNQDGFQAIAPGLEEIYRRGRKALARAQKKPTALNYHELRKRVKDHWYHIRLLESLWTEVMQSHEASLKELETWLGDDHNLVVLREKLEDKPEKYGPQEQIQVFLSLSDREQKELREKSISLAERVYGQKPAAFVKNISKVWEAWQEQPDSMKDSQKAERKAQSKPATKVSGKKSKKAA